MSTPREIEFKDTREGDDIEVQWELGDTLETRRGVAYEKVDGYFWYTKGGRMLVDSLGNHVRILLHHRPAPTEPEGLGVVIEYAGNEYVSINRTPGTPRWVFVADNRTYNEAVVYSWSEFDPDNIEVEE